MKKIIIIIIVLVTLAILGFGAYTLFSPKNSTGSQVGTGDGAGIGAGQTGTLPLVNVSSSANGVTAASVFSNLPTSTQIAIGTSKGTVQVNNFYLTNPDVDSDGDVILKTTQNYVIVYDPSDSSFWLGITGSPFATWQSAAEQDFLPTLGVSVADACKLDVTSGVIYSPGNPYDGEDFPLTFCTGGAFQIK